MCVCVCVCVCVLQTVIVSIKVVGINDTNDNQLIFIFTGFPASQIYIVGSLASVLDLCVCVGGGGGIFDQ